MNLILAISSAGCMPNVSRYKYGFLKKKERQAASKSKHASTCAEAAPATHMKVPLKVFELDRDRYHGVDPDVLRIALKENGTPSKRRRCTTPHESAVFNALQSDLAHGNASFRGARNMAACSAADIINGGGKVPDGTAGLATCGNCGEAPQNIEREYVGGGNI